MYVVLCLIVFGCQYQCNWLPGKTRLRNDLLCVQWDAKPFRLSHSYKDTGLCYPQLKALGARKRSSCKPELPKYLKAESEGWFWEGNRTLSQPAGEWCKLPHRGWRQTPDHPNIFGTQDGPILTPQAGNFGLLAGCSLGDLDTLGRGKFPSKRCRR